MTQACLKSMVRAMLLACACMMGWPLPAQALDDWPDPAPRRVEEGDLHVRSQDALLQGLARMAGAAFAAPESADAGPTGDSLVDMRRLRSVELLGTQVLPPLLQAMAAREYDTLQLDFEDGACVRLCHGQRGWQFWRRPLATLDGGAG